MARHRPVPLDRDLAALLALIDSAGYLKMSSPAVVEAMNWTNARLKELIG